MVYVEIHFNIYSGEKPGYVFWSTDFITHPGAKILWLLFSIVLVVRLIIRSLHNMQDNILYERYCQRTFPPKRHPDKMSCNLCWAMQSTPACSAESFVKSCSDMTLWHTLGA